MAIHTSSYIIIPLKWHAMNRKDVPNKLNINPTAPLVLNWLRGLVAKLADFAPLTE